MKHPLIFFSLCLFHFTGFSQVEFENISFKESLNRAKQTGKLVFLQFDAADCQQCNEVADKAFNNEILSTQLNETFICIRITTDHPDRSNVSLLYDRKKGSFGSLFINSDGTLIHNYSGSASAIRTYQEHIDKALIKAGEGTKLSQLEKEYNSGNKSPGMMELLMQTRKTLGLQSDSLLEEYVRVLPPDSLESSRTLKFIVNMAPVLLSEADQQLRKNVRQFNESWNEISEPLRIGINMHIASKSMQKAINEKNEPYAYRVAGFVKGTFQGPVGQQGFDQKMIEYYKGVNDTSNYFSRSEKYYDRYFMNMPVDTMKKRDSARLKALFAKQPFPAPDETGKMRQTVGFSPMTQVFNRELNNAAHTFYEMTNDAGRLTKALNWSTRANEFFESYVSMNTNALLLFKLGRKDEAILWQNRAIESKRKRGFDPKDLEKEKEKMEKGKL